MHDAEDGACGGGDFDEAVDGDVGDEGGASVGTVGGPAGGGLVRYFGLSEDARSIPGRRSRGRGQRDGNGAETGVGGEELVFARDDGAAE